MEGVSTSGGTAGRSAGAAPSGRFEPVGEVGFIGNCGRERIGGERLRRLGNPVIERLNSDGAVDGAPPGACEERISSGCGPANYSASA